MKQHDVVVVGSGPAGISAAISSAAEGYRTLVIDSAQSWGGQAFHSSRIENVFGYPQGVPGKVLMDRSVQQAERLGVTFLRSRATAIEQMDGELWLGVGGRTDDAGPMVRTKSVVLATGVEYRRLDAPGCRELEGKGVFYMTTPGADEACAFQPAVVVGGGNSAGQAALHMSQRARKVLLVVRRGDIASTMSDYLVKRIERTPNIDIRYHTTIDRCYGRDYIAGVELHSPDAAEEVKVGAVFVMIGAVPTVKWAPVDRDSDGFIVAPDLETSMPGVLAIGDVRSGSVKRVASAAGEGAYAMRHINRLVKGE